jgi:Ca-activated chloride channel family protein
MIKTVKGMYRPLGRWKSTGRMWGGRCLAVFSLLFPLSFFAFPQTTPESGEFKISTDVVLVLLDVSVKDTKGGYVPGLSKDDFHVYENGALQKITVFASADVPVAVGLVMDDSGSMQPKRPELITAGVAFVEASNPQDQIFVVNFNDKVRRGLPQTTPFTDDVNLLRSALSRSEPQGRTALYDAIAFALHHVDSGQRDKKALVVVSDGGDTCSTHSFKELMRLIQESHTTIYTVGIFDADDIDRNPQVLKRIASASGGECFLPTDFGELRPICKRIAKDIRNRYTVGYIPARTSEKTGLRKIRVAVDAPGHERLIVRTRTGYSVPSELRK